MSPETEANQVNAFSRNSVQFFKLTKEIPRLPTNQLGINGSVKEIADVSTFSPVYHYDVKVIILEG